MKIDEDPVPGPCRICGEETAVGLWLEIRDGLPRSYRARVCHVCNPAHYRNPEVRQRLAAEIQAERSF